MVETRYATFIVVVVVYHVTIVAMDMGLTFLVPSIRSTHCREFLYVKLSGPAYFVRTTQL